jgi:hypothetical protein
MTALYRVDEISDEQVAGYIAQAHREVEVLRQSSYRLCTRCPVVGQVN